MNSLKAENEGLKHKLNDEKSKMLNIYKVMHDKEKSSGIKGISSSIEVLRLHLRRIEM